MLSEKLTVNKEAFYFWMTDTHSDLSVLLRSKEKDNFYGTKILQYKQIFIRINKVLSHEKVKGYEVCRYVGRSDTFYKIPKSIKQFEFTNFKSALRKAASLYHQAANKKYPTYIVEAYSFSKIEIKIDWECLIGNEPCKVPFLKLPSEKMVKNLSFRKRLSRLEI